MERVTMEQIAKVAGVSTSTVSKVLNGRKDVSAATRHRIQELTATYSYERRSAPKGPPPVIDLVFEELESPWATEIIRGAVAAAQQQGLRVALTSLSEGTEGKVWLDHIISRGTVGVMLLLSSLSVKQRSALRSQRLAFVVIDPKGDPGPDVPAIGATNWAGGLDATRHLIELGHKRIAVIGGKPDLLSSRARMDGYHAAMGTAGFPIDPRLVRWGDFHVEGGYKNAEALLALDEPPSAIFAGSDLQAIGVIEAARECGLRVPDDLSIVGFDDLPISTWTSPPLTTVRQPLTEMAMMGVELIIALAGNEPVASSRLEVATSLIVRESTAPPRENRDVRTA
jgi:DNA-binding LacI/PurR family transcriptional regulator